MQINAERLQCDLMTLAEIGATAGGGVTRLALSDEDRMARDLLGKWMQDAGLQVRVDDFGNMIGTRPGTEALPPVRIGSHLDTQPTGGRYDGALGVVTALEVVRTLNDHGVATRHPLEVVNWTNEEGARFEPAMQGSGAVTWRMSKESIYERTDRRGLRFVDELQRIGYLGLEEHRPGPAIVYLELHIEQGPVLETAGLPVGIVEGIVGISWLEVTLNGQADHAGPTPMERRRDALAGAAHLIAAIEELALGQEDAVATVGRIAVEPNVVNVIPGRAVLSVDVRHRSARALQRLNEQIGQLALDIAAERGLDADVRHLWTSEPTRFDPDLVYSVKKVADTLGVPAARLWSGAGHDAKYMAEVSPTAMIFVRSQGGLSHCEQEYSTPEDIEAGANVLLGSVLLAADV